MSGQPPVVALRVASASDALCIAVLATQVFLDTYATQGFSQSIAQEALEHFSLNSISAQIAEPSTTFIVAESAGHLVGFAQLVFGSGHVLVGAQAAAKLNRLYVHERFTGRGIGKALLRRSEEVAASNGAFTLWLTAWVDNHRALGFYASRGYTDLGPTMYVFQDEQFENRLLATPVRAPTGT